MKRNFINKALAAVTAVALVASASIAYAQDTALGKRVNLFLKDADLLTATRLLSAQTGLKFVVSPTSEQFGKINLSLEDIAAEDAIRYICQAAGGYAERDANGVFVIRFGTDRPSQTQIPVSQEPVATEIVKVIQVRKADPRDLLEMMAHNNGYDPDRMYKDLWEYRKYTNPGYGVMPTTTEHLTPMLNRLNGPQVTAADTGGSLSLPTGSDPQRGGAQGGGGQVGGGGGGGQLGGGGGGQNGGGSFQGVTGGQGLVPTGTTSLGYNPATNSLIFRGTPDAYNKLLAILDQLDQAPKQIIVKVEFITTTSGLDKALGIDWYYERGGIFAGVRPGAFAASSDPVFLNYATGNLSTRLRTLLTEGTGRVVTAPLVRTLNNQLATITAGANTWIFLTQQIVTAAGSFTTTTPISIPITTSLQVRPRINADNTITMTLAPTITNITGFRTGPDGSQLPETAFQSLQVAIIVKDGETIALGGLTGKTDSFTQSRIPLLSDLPVIGQLFRRRRNTQNNTELLIFVTAKIIDENQSGLGIP